DIEEVDRKIELGEAREAVGEVIDGVVFGGQRTVAAVISDFQLETKEDLFGGLHGHEDGLAVLDVAAFLIGGEGEDEIARGLEVFALHTQEGGDEGGVVALHVGSSASVEVAVLFAEDEGVEGPVGAAGFDDVEGSEEENWARRAGAVQADHEVTLAGDGGEDVDVALRPAGGAEAGGHGFGGAGVVAGGIGGIDFDELLEDFAGELLAGRLGAERNDRENGGKEAHTVIMPLGRTLIILGLVLVAAGVVVTLAGRSPIPFGRL